MEYVVRVVLETDPNVIAGKVAMQSTEASGSLSEQVTTLLTIIVTSPCGKAIVLI